MQRKWVWLAALILFLGVFLAACGGADEDVNGEENGSDVTEGTETAEDGSNSEAQEGERPDFMSMLTGGTSGTYYPLGGEMASIISDEVGIQTDAVSSNASADNVVALQEGEAEIAFVQTDVVAHAVEGINVFDGDPVDNVLALGSLYPETVQIVTTAGSDVESVEDLEGKTVSVGAPGSGTYVNAEQILEVHGLTMDDIDAENLDFGESTGGIQDGNIDAAFITAGTPTGAVEGLQATADVRIVPIAEDKIEEIIENYPYYAEDTIPEGTYGLDEDIQTVAVMAMLAVTDELSEEVVYEVTKAIYENADTISHARGESISTDMALDGIGIDLHPGAERYFDEAGVLE
jgi:hypothetical protein